MAIRIGDRSLGPGNPCLIVAEAGSAHQGEVSAALELIDAAASAGADCIKFQVIFAEEIVHPRTGSIDLPGGSTPIFQRFRALERDLDFYARLKDHTENRGVLFLASCFGLRSARLLRDLGVQALKVASPELNHFPLLRELSGYRLPLILSTGVSTLCDIERALTVTGPRTALLHCVTAYPAPEQEYNLRLLQHMAAIFGVPVGVSDHSADPLLVPGLAVSQGACLLEKHLTLSSLGAGLDDPIALEPEAFQRMVRGIRRIEEAGAEEGIELLAEEFGRDRVAAVLGDGVKRLAPSERRFYRTTNRSLHAVGQIREGRVIREEDVCIVRSEANLRPGLGPEYLEWILGCRARRRIPAGEGINWQDILPPAPSS